MDFSIIGLCVSAFLVAVHFSAADAVPDSPQEMNPGIGGNQITVDRGDVINHMFYMANLCESVLDGVTEYENQGFGEDENVVVQDSALQLLKYLQLRIFKVSCITMMYTSAAAEKAALTEAVQDNEDGTTQAQNQ